MCTCTMQAMSLRSVPAQIQIQIQIQVHRDCRDCRGCKVRCGVSHTFPQRPSAPSPAVLRRKGCRVTGTAQLPPARSILHNNVAFWKPCSKPPPSFLLCCAALHCTALHYNYLTISVSSTVFAPDDPPQLGRARSTRIGRIAEIKT